MNTYILIGIGFGLVVFLFFLKVVFRKDKTYDHKRFPKTGLSLNDEAVKLKVNELIANGRKIEAIKYLHDNCNTGLSEAKKLVEFIEILNPNKEIESSSFDKKEDKVYNSEETEDYEILNKLKDLLKEGKKIEAIKFVIENHKSGLAEAKEFVEKVNEQIKAGKT